MNLVTPSFIRGFGRNLTTTLFNSEDLTYKKFTTMQEIKAGPPSDPQLELCLLGKVSLPNLKQRPAILRHKCRSYSMQPIVCGKTSVLSLFWQTCEPTNELIPQKKLWWICPESRTTCVSDGQPKRPHSEGLKFKNHSHKDWQGHTHTHSLSSLLGPVSVMDGESVAYSCIQLTNCPPPIAAPSPPCDLWKMGRDGMSRQLRLEKGQRGWRRTKEVNLEKIIYLRVYRPPRCGWAPSACEHTYVWARLETRFSHDLAASRTARTFLFVVCWW